MLNKLLLSNKYKLIGWFILIPAAIAGIILLAVDFEMFRIDGEVFAVINQDFMKDVEYFTFQKGNITVTLTGALLIVGALLVSFSKEKIEDEYISRLRLSALLWSVLVNYILLLLAFLFIYGLAFVNVMLYNMYTILILFIIRFHYLLYKNNKIAADEK